MRDREHSLVKVQAAVVEGPQALVPAVAAVVAHKLAAL